MLKKKITILVPAYNEADNLPLLVQGLKSLSSNMIRPSADEDSVNVAADMDMRNYEWEYLFVNDGSRDNTLEVLRQLRSECDRVNIVNLSRNFGKENAMLAGMDHATGDAVIIIDADGQHPLDVIPVMIGHWEKGYDDVYGKHITRDNNSLLRKKFTAAFYRLLQRSTRIDILPNVGDFRLLDRRVVNAIRQLRETQRYTKGLYCWVGYSKKEVKFRSNERLNGSSSFNFMSLLNLAIEGVTSFTTAPLRLSTVLGFMVSIAALSYMLYVFVKTLVWGDPVAGYPTLLCVMLFLGGVQLIAIGIIGEYIGRIFNESKNRPVYIVESYNEEKR